MTDKQITADLFFISKLLDGENFQEVYDETYSNFRCLIGCDDGGVVYD